MGIHGLLPFLKPYVKKVNIEDFKGRTVGVDAMCWMHRGAFACSRELVEGVDTDKFVRFFLRMCEVLRFSQIKPIIVFDGDKLPAKAKEDEARGKAREQARLEALELLERRRGGHEIDEKAISSKCEGAIKVTASMISRLQSALKELSIDFMIAPYEADAQLAYMCRMGWIEVVISEDSDLLAYGCPSVLFKMDKYGNGDHIALPCLQVDAAPCREAAQVLDKENAAPEPQDNVPAQDRTAKKGPGRQKLRLKTCKAGKAVRKGCKPTKSLPEAPEEAPSSADGCQSKKDLKDISLPTNSSKLRRGKKANDVAAAAREVQSWLDRWSPEQFAEFCVFCGTDYKEPDTHIKQFGIKTAFKLMIEHGNAHSLLKWMVGNKDFQPRLPCKAEEYIPRFTSVVCVFWHHLVFNLKNGECTSIATAFPLTESQRHCSNLDPATVCGFVFPKSEALRVARGELDPRTRTQKTLEPLTPAERQAIDSMLESKRREQQEYRQQVAEEQAEARRAEAQARQAMEEEVPPALAAAEDVPDVANDGRVAQDVPELKLLPGDLNKLRRFHELQNDEGDASETGAPHHPPAGESVGRSTAKPSNPFGRKRPAQSSCMAIPGTKNLCIRPAVRGLAPHQESTKSKDDFVKFKKPEYHPRGGGAASAAVEAVLAQRGIPGVNVEEDKDKSKLRFFFEKPGKHAHAKTGNFPDSRGEEEKVKLDILSSWKSRPWEVEPEVTDAAPRVNGLAMQKKRWSFSKGW